MIHIFLVRGESYDIKDTVKCFKTRKFTIYDHEYPYKLAAPIALRQNVPGIPKVISSDVTLVSRRISELMLLTKGHQQLFKNFNDWLYQQKTDRVLIVGVPYDSMWDGAVNHLKRQLQLTEIGNLMTPRDIMKAIDSQVMKNSWR